MQKKAWQKRINLRFLAGLTTIQLILIVVFLSCGATLAFLTATESVTNRFILAEPTITVKESNVSNPDSVEWGPNSKNVQIVVSSAHGSVYVKTALILSAKDSAGNAYPLNTGILSAPDITTGQLSAGDFTLYFNPDWENDWFFKNGYFYYKHILMPGEETNVLLKGITLTNNTDPMKAKYQNLTVQADILASSIQAKNSAVTAWGVSLDADGVTLIP